MAESEVMAAVAAEVPDSAVGPERDEDQHRLDTMLKVSPKLEQIMEHIDMVERAMGGMLPEVVARAPLGTAVDIVSTITKAYEAALEALEAIGKRISYVKELSLPDRFDAEKVKTFNTDQFRVTKTVRLMASIVPEEKEAAFKWLRDNNYDALIKETVNASSLSTAAKELMESGKELPDDYFRTHSKNGVSITKLKPKRG